MSLKHVLTICCLLFAFAGNAAWAATDYHLVSDDIAAADVSIGHPSAPDTPNDGCSDHCCHASAHFLGLPGATPEWFLARSADIRPVSDQQPLSHPQPPLFEPPIA